MARLFVSYSRVDRRFVEALAEKIRRIYGHDNVWFDEGLHGGDIWWEEILDQIAARDIFIYVLTNDSVQSPYCQAEFAEARRLQKQIITVQARDRTRLTDELGDIHYVNMAGGVDDADALTELIRSINKRMTKVPRRKPRPLWEPRTPKPEPVDEKPRPDDDPDIDTPTLQIPRVERERVDATTKRPWWRKTEFVIGAVLIPLIAAVITIFPWLAGQLGGNQPTPVPTTAVAQGVTQLPTDEPSPTETSTASLTPTSTPSLTATPTLSQTEVEETVQAEMNAIVLDNARTAEAAETATAEQERQHSRGTAAALTLTATLWTATPTIDTRATAEARLTATQDWINSWTDTPTATSTQTPTFTATSTPTNTPTFTATPTNTPPPTPTLAPEQLAQTPVAANAAWESYTTVIDGVEMVLVPAGCFMMGSNNGDDDEQPVHQVCFDEPFWIDRYEVTNAHYGSIGCEQWSAEPDQPRNCVYWDDARDFCTARDARLPTEAEWEYVARGPDGLIYPWGDYFVGEYAIYAESPEYGGTKTAPVGTLPLGASWVGALDLSGNVWEWVADWYGDYSRKRQVNPQGPDDGQHHVLRGGSFGYTSNLLRAADRYGFNPDGGWFFVGFRCARSF